MRFIFLTLCLVHATSAAGLFNVAYKKPAVMSSKLSAAAGKESKITDGVVNKKIGFCVQTRVAANSWVRVDLQGRYRVYMTTISTPINQPQADYKILVTEKPFYNLGFPPNNIICRIHGRAVPGYARAADYCNFNDAPLVGRYVTMVRKGVTSLKICELQVFAEPADTDKPVFNVALNKPVRQSNPNSANARPNKVNDGNLEGNFVTLCTVAEPQGGNPPWIQLDLQAQYTISVVLYRDSGLRYGQVTRLGNRLNLLVTNNPQDVTVRDANICGWYSALRVDTTALKCKTPKVGRYVVITQNVSEPMYACEILIFVPGVATPATTTQPPTTTTSTTTTTTTTTTTAAPTTTTQAVPDVCASNPCKNGATCSVQVTKARLALFKCTCAEGFSGETCDKTVDTSGACASRPCQNGGSCKPTAYGSFKCTCPALYQGDNCEIKSAWVNSPCGDAENGCTGVNTVCFKGKCLCTPGYYYSLSSQTCIKSCPKPSLQSSFMIYPGSRIKKNKDAKELNLNPDECKAICSKDKNCLCISMLNNEVKPKCFLHVVDVQDVPDDWTDTREDWDYYQRHCA